MAQTEGKRGRYSKQKHKVSDLEAAKISREIWMWAYVKTLEMFHWFQFSDLGFTVIKLIRRWEGRKVKLTVMLCEQNKQWKPKIKQKLNQEECAVF